MIRTCNNALVYSYLFSPLCFILRFTLTATYCIFATRHFCSLDLKIFIRNIPFACLFILAWYIYLANLDLPYRHCAPRVTAFPEINCYGWATPRSLAALLSIFATSILTKWSTWFLRHEYTKIQLGLSSLLKTWTDIIRLLTLQSFWCHSKRNFNLSSQKFSQVDNAHLSCAW